METILIAFIGIIAYYASKCISKNVIKELIFGVKEPAICKLRRTNAW